MKRYIMMLVVSIIIIFSSINITGIVSGDNPPERWDQPRYVMEWIGRTGKYSIIPNNDGDVLFFLNGEGSENNTLFIINHTNPTNIVQREIGPAVWSDFGIICDPRGNIHLAWDRGGSVYHVIYTSMGEIIHTPKIIYTSINKERVILTDVKITARSESDFSVYWKEKIFEDERRLDMTNCTMMKTIGDRLEDNYSTIELFRTNATMFQYDVKEGPEYSVGMIHINDDERDTVLFLHASDGAVSTFLFNFTSFDYYGDYLSLNIAHLDREHAYIFWSNARSLNYFKFSLTDKIVVKECKIYNGTALFDFKVFLQDDLFYGIWCNGEAMDPPMLLEIHFGIFSLEGNLKYEEAITKKNGCEHNIETFYRFDGTCYLFWSNPSWIPGLFMSYIIDTYPHDLKVDEEDISIITKRPVEEKEIDFRTVIENNNTIPLTTAVSVLIDGVEIHNETLALEAKSVFPMNFNCTLPEGEHNLSVIVNPNNTTLEYDYRNNAVSMVFHVYGKEDDSQQVNIYGTHSFVAIMGIILLVSVWNRRRRK